MVKYWGPAYWIEVLGKMSIDPSVSRRTFHPKDTIFECPSAEKEFSSLPNYLKGGIGYNDLAGSLYRTPRSEPVQRFWNTTIQVSAITVPSQSILLGDDKINNNSGPNFLHTRLLNANRTVSHPRNRHQYATNCYWADGHVEQMLHEEYLAIGESKNDRDWLLKLIK